MSSPNETVSVVMATRNAARYLPDALASIAAQTRPADEVVIVDKESTDDTVAIAEASGARVLQQRGTGFAGAWNEGIEVAEGSQIALLDSDDHWDPGKLEAQTRMLAERPDLGCVIGRVRFFVEPGQELPPSFHMSLLGTDHVAPMPGALLARNWMFDEIGMFPTDFEVANDIDWFARVKDSEFEMGVADDALIHKRIHSTNHSYSNARELNTELMRILRDSIARQRSASR